MTTTTTQDAAMLLKNPYWMLMKEHCFVDVYTRILRCAFNGPRDSTIMQAKVRQSIFYAGIMKRHPDMDYSEKALEKELMYRGLQRMSDFLKERLLSLGEMGLHNILVQMDQARIAFLTSLGADMRYFA